MVMLVLEVVEVLPEAVGVQLEVVVVKFDL